MAAKPGITLGKFALILFGAYIVCLMLWLPLKSYYAAAISYGAAQLTSVFQEVSYQKMEVRRDSTVVTFDFHHSLRTSSGSYTINTSAYDFSMPLILALLPTFAPFLTTKCRPLLIIASVTIGIHLLYMVLSQCNAINLALAREGFGCGGKGMISFMREWIGLLVLRFLPFLCGFYLAVNTSFWGEWRKRRTRKDGIR